MTPIFEKMQIVPVVISATTATYSDENDKIYTEATLTIDFVFYDAGCKVEVIHWTGEGTGWGYGDVAMNKAITSATDKLNHIRKNFEEK